MRSIYNRFKAWLDNRNTPQAALGVFNKAISKLDKIEKRLERQADKCVVQINHSELQHRITQCSISEEIARLHKVASEEADKARKQRGLYINKHNGIRHKLTKTDRIKDKLKEFLQDE